MGRSSRSRHSTSTATRPTDIVDPTLKAAAALMPSPGPIWTDEVSIDGPAHSSLQRSTVRSRWWIRPRRWASPHRLQGCELGANPGKGRAVPRARLSYEWACLPPVRWSCSCSPGTLRRARPARSGARIEARRWRWLRVGPGAGLSPCVPHNGRTGVLDAISY